ncbi:SCO family protein [Cellulophaga sp. 20_2_10]|uniref:SCO family protein n=1 Tax=Cellulophaga sp. 20_2_10 TaxID=2942476 RepID=UPI00201A6477|nr:SCO family protein [Cellulophaga sp. 20_2_10]MCL5245749.1 SCO family protein [Cellulophaga sp. 20_2_10]
MKKNNYNYIWISFIILVFGIIFIPKIIDRINSGQVVENDRMNKKDNKGNLAYVEIDGNKKRVPDFTFINQDSLVVSNRDYLGKVYIVEFFFTSCPSICPIMTKNLVQIQNDFKGLENFGIASFSIDPEHDTPTKLKTYSEANGITNLDWHLMTGDRDEIYELANKGFNIFAQENSSVPGGFEHSGLFALVDKRGFIRSRVDEFGNPIIYYRGTISEEEGANDEGEKEQIGILKEDIKKLLNE